MPPGLAITLVLVAACTLAALKPVRKPEPVSLLGYLMGMVFNEAPFAVFLYLLVPTAALTFIEGGVESPFGWIVAAAMLLLVVALTLIGLRQLRAGDEVRAALDSSLGSGWKERAHAVSKAKPQPGPSRLRTLVAPLPLGRFGVKRVANQSYGDAGRRNLLDVYHHRALPQGAPVLVYFHGGHFRSGHKRREGRPLILRLAGNGWVCISANYRLQPQASFPDFVVDAKKVITWAKENAARFGADPDAVFIAGSSAGGHMSTIAGLSANDPSFQPGFEESDTTVSGFISLYGYYGRQRREPELRSSPYGHIGPDAAPGFIAHGTIDTVIRVEGARRFAEQLDETSRNPVTYVELHGAQHGFDLLHSPRMERVVDGIENWAAWVRAG